MIYAVYNKHEIIKLAIKPEKNPKYYRKCSNNFAADCRCRISSSKHTLESGTIEVVKNTPEPLLVT